MPANAKRKAATLPDEHDSAAAFQAVDLREHQLQGPKVRLNENTNNAVADLAEVPPIASSLDERSSQ